MNIFRLSTALMVLVFLLSAAVQYNDPDGLLWISVYGCAAAFSLAAFFERLRWELSSALALAAIVWAFSIYPDFAGQVSFSELVGAFTMKSDAIEYAREAGGLVLISFWMFVLTIKAHNRERRALESSGE